MPAPLKTGRVLVVDDEPSIRDAVATALRYEGFDVHEAATGRSALESATGQPPDVVILDLMLPDVDGIQVCRMLREAGQDCHVLFLTARNNVANKVTGLGAGGDDYITKPFSLAEIVARANAVMRRRLMPVVPPLLGNVRVHTPQGTSVRIEARRKGTHVVVMVADDGPGLTADERARMFDRFWRKDPSRSREAGGNGLGLSIVATTVKTWNGHVAASRTPGGGLTVTLVLPAVPP